MNRSISLLLATVVFLSVGCATILNGSEQEVNITSNVEGASIYLDDKMIGETPFTGKIPKDKKKIVIKKDGYKTKTLFPTSKFSTAFFGNLLSGGTTGMTTDISNGAAYEYSPSTFQVDLVKENGDMSMFRKKVNVRSYAMIEMSGLAVDLGNGQGQHLSTLLELLDMPQNSESVAKIKSLYSQSNADEVVFGNKLVALL